jgi:dienelactone hydrolase
MREQIRLALVLTFVMSAGRGAAEEVRFPPAGVPSTPGAVLPQSIPATLSLPRNATGRVPAVVIVHASAGLLPNGPESGYAAALDEAGIATLVIDMWAARGMPAGAAAFGGDGGVDRRPRVPSDTLPDAFGALKYLAAQPGIDARHIGILGFSWGAVVSLLAASESAANRAIGPNLCFAAHVGHYFVCWPYSPDGPGVAFLAAPWTNAPIQLQVAGRDDYDDADGGASCKNLVESLSPEKRQHVSLIVHADVTHAWDVKLPFPMSFDDRYSHRGKGGPVHFAYDAAVTAAARAATIAFFKASFGMD